MNAAVEQRSTLTRLEAARRVELRLTSDTAQIAPARRAVEALAGAAGFDDAACGEIGLCVNEALANVIRHAYARRGGRPILLRAELNADAERGATSLRVVVRDWGSGINPASLPDAPYDPAAPGGVGLLCLRSLMDEVSYAPQPDGMELTLVRRLPPRVRTVTEGNG